MYTSYTYGLAYGIHYLWILVYYTSAKPNPKVHSAALGKANSSKNDNGPRKGKSKGSTAPSTAHQQEQSNGKGDFISNRKMKKHLLAMSRSKNAAKAFDQFSTLVERQHNRIKRMASVKKEQKAKGQDASSSDDSDEVSIHVMSPAEVTKVRWDSMRKELQTTLARNKRTICFDPEEEQLEGEAAFKKHYQDSFAEESESNN